MPKAIDCQRRDIEANYKRYGLKVERKASYVLRIDDRFTFWLGMRYWKDDRSPVHGYHWVSLRDAALRARQPPPPARPRLIVSEGFAVD